MSRLPFVSVVVPVRNGEGLLDDCLTSLLNVDYPRERHELLVVDNGSTDQTAAIARRYPVRYLFEPRRGSALARNRGIAASVGEIVAFIDADCLATSGWVGALVERLSDGRTAAVGGEIVPYPPATAAERYVAARKPRWQQWSATDRARPWLVSANCALRRRALEHVGPFDPAFARVGCEDIDLSWRLAAAGFTLRLEPRAIVFHRHRATVRGFLAQQVRNGRGQAALRRKYGGAVPWGAREELGAWADLCASAWRLVRPRAEAGELDFERRCFDLLRKLAQRIGFAIGALDGKPGAALGEGER